MIQNSSVHWTYSGDDYCTAITIAEGSVRLWNLRSGKKVRGSLHALMLSSMS